MKLLEDFLFTDPNDRVWTAPKGTNINGASIPRPLWSIVGSPYTDDYRRASIVHDVACTVYEIPRKDADVMFFHACHAGGCNPLQSKILYAGVRIGAWSSESLPEETLTRENFLFQDPLNSPIASKQFLKGTLSDISDELKNLPDEASIEQLDAVIDKYLKFTSN